MPTMLTADGVRLHYDVSGSGETLVLIHGGFSTADFWAAVVPRLAERFTVVTYDRRGHGLSGGDPASGTIQDDVADVATVLTHLGASRAHLAGISMGGTIALRTAIEHPALVGRVAVHEPALIDLLGSRAKHAALYARIVRLNAETRRLLEEDRGAEAAELFSDQVAFGEGTWAHLAAEDRESMIAHGPTFLGELRDPDARSLDVGRLAELTAPMLISHGRLSMPLFHAIDSVLGLLLPDAERYTFDSAGHLPNLTHTDEYAHVVTEFLSH